MTIFGLGKESKDTGMYSTPQFGYDFASTINNPQEHLTYYSESHRGDYPEAIASLGAKRIVDEYRPEKTEYTTRQQKFLGMPIPWAKPDTIGWSIEHEREPSMNVTDLVKYIQDREAALNIYDELSSEYMTDAAAQHYYKR